MVKIIILQACQKEPQYKAKTVKYIWNIKDLNNNGTVLLI